MTTDYGGIGVTLVHDPESYDINSDSQDNYQEDVNDLEHTEHNHSVELKHLTNTKWNN